MNLRLPILLLLLLTGSLISAAPDDPPTFVIQNEIILSSDERSMDDPALAISPEGTVYRSWLETKDSTTAFRLSRFDPLQRTWGVARTITEDHTHAEDRPRAPLLAAGPNGRLAALWQTGARLWISTTTDAGSSWSPPARLTSESKTQGTAALAALPDGHFLAAWIDLRKETPALYARVLGRERPDSPVDFQVNAASPPALATFADGSALVAWRSDSGEGRDIHTARWDDRQWTKPTLLNADGWKPLTPPAEGVALDARGAHVAAVWFTAAENARINSSISGDAGRQWLLPTRIDDIAPLGRAALVMLDDGSQLVSWVERAANGDHVILLRRISPRGTLSVPARLARLQADPGRPQLIRLKDGDATPAQLLLVYATVETDSSSRRLQTRLITLPDASQLAETDTCDCDPHPEELRGYPLKGKIVSINAARATLLVDHEAVPGLMKAAQTEFKAAPDLLAGAQAGQRIFARMERRGPDWWLLNVHTLVTP